MSQTKAQLLNPQGDFTLTGQLIGVGATFSGNVSIAGTLTKQDVTNVDSVGVITARSDIIVGGNIAHLGDTDTKIAFTNNQIDFQANNSSRLYVNQYATYLQTAYPLAFLSSSGASPSIKSGGSNNQDLLLTTGTDNPTRLHIQSDGKIGIGTNSASALLHIEGTQTGLQIERNAQTLKIDANHGNGGDQSLEASAALRIYTNGANERIRIASNGNVKIGSGSPNLAVGSGLEIDTGGAVTIRLEDSGAGSGFEIQNTGGVIKQRLYNGQSWVIEHGSGEKFRVASSGQIGIAGANYGNAGQVLTSGGSGSTVSWADAAGGAEFAGIASGSISTGNPVMVHSDGKLGKVKYNWNESITTGALAEGSNTIASAGAWGSWARNDDGTTWDGDGTSDDRVLFMFRYGNTPGYRTADYSGNTLTLNSLSSWNDGDGIAEWDAAYNSNGKRFAAVYRHNSNGRARFVVGRPNGTTVTWGTGTNGSSGRLEISSDSTTNAVGVEYAGNDKFVVGYGVGNKVYAQVVTNSSGSNYMTLSAGSRTEIEDIGAAVTYKIHITKPDSNGRMILFYMKPLGGDFGLKMAVLTISGTSVSYDGRAWVSSSNTVYTRPAARTSYDPNEDRYLLIYERMSNNRMYGRNMKITAADAISMSAETQLHDQNPADQGGDTVYDTNLKKHFVYLTNAPTSKLSYVPVTFTGSAAPTAGTLGIIYNNTKVLRSFITEFDPTLGKILLASRNQSSSGSGDYLGGLITTTATSETNLTRTNFIGFSKGNYTDGNTAKVNVNGSVDENQSSLTPGQTYFVKEDGTLSLTTDKTRVAAGQAVSSTNLIVRDENPRQGILGFWQYHLQEQGSAYKPWCACRYVGGYARDQNGNCNFCTGKWTPWCCNGTAVNSGQQHVWDIPDENGGNMCISCGGLSKGSQFCMHTGACCCCCPDGRFYFPSTGLYCYNFDMMWLSCQQMAVGGCWNVSTLWNGRKCHNNACDQCMWPIQNWRGNPNTCLYCESRMWANNIFISGMVSVADPAANFILWKVCDSSIGVQIRNNGLFQCEAGMQQVSNWVNFTKLSNSPGSYYCN